MKNILNVRCLGTVLGMVLLFAGFFTCFLAVLDEQGTYVAVGLVLFIVGFALITLSGDRTRNEREW
jgi:uncharacterized membrane protein